MADAPRFGPLAPMPAAAPPAPYDPPPEAVPPDMGIRSAVRLGVIILLVFFGGFGGWAAFVPLSSAAIAPGVVGPETNRKTIQHLEGGVVEDILVKNGDLVQDGDLLLRLESTQSGAVTEQLRSRQLASTILEARLIAERDGAARIVYPQALMNARQDPKFSEAIAAQENIFAARRHGLESQTSILRQRVLQSREEIRGLKDQVTSDDRQLQLVREEIKDLSGLVEKGLAQKPRLLAAQRREAEIEGARAQRMASIARAQQGIGESEMRVIELKTQRLNEVVAELRDVQVELAEVYERLRAAEDVLRRIEIRAPIAGTVVALTVFTRGGVVAPGQKLLDIVPRDDRLIIEAQVSPQDIDVVYAGLPAQVRFTAFSQRSLRPLEAKVMTVSADRLVDEKSGQSYYSARVELLEEPSKVLDEALIQAGMPAEVMIVTGKRTALSYLVRPLFVGASRAFREN
jgi:membrane fusion protein, epimerase transport system